MGAGGVTRGSCCVYILGLSFTGETDAIILDGDRASPADLTPSWDSASQAPVGNSTEKSAADLAVPDRCLDTCLETSNENALLPLFYSLDVNFWAINGH